MGSPVEWFVSIERQFDDYLNMYELMHWRSKRSARVDPIRSKSVTLDLENKSQTVMKSTIVLSPYAPSEEFLWPPAAPYYSITGLRALN